jgi:hypothetical protein
MAEPHCLMSAECIRHGVVIWALLALLVTSSDRILTRMPFNISQERVGKVYQKEQGQAL